MVLDQEEEQDSRYLAATFKVDPGRLESLGRSIGLLLRDRRCPTCWATLINESDQGLSIKARDHLKRVAEHCSKQLDYITHGMPIMEAVFRIEVEASYMTGAIVNVSGGRELFVRS